MGILNSRIHESVKFRTFGHLIFGLPCPPWRDSFSIDVCPRHPGLGQGRDRSWTMPRKEKPGLGQGIMEYWISWHWDRDGPFGIGLYGSSMNCYDSKGEPRWFRPGMWDDPETYAFSKHGDLVNIETFEKDSSGPVEIRVLLYNEKENEAYFVISSWDH